MPYREIPIYRVTGPPVGHAGRVVDLDVLHFKGWTAWSPAALATRGATGAPDQPHLRLFGARPAAQAGADPIVAALLAAGAEVIPAELATLADGDLTLSATGGLG